MPGGNRPFDHSSCCGRLPARCRRRDGNTRRAMQFVRLFLVIGMVVAKLELINPRKIGWRERSERGECRTCCSLKCIDGWGISS
nr:hypothetical protein CFP56_73862 [Quercus suber]